MREHVFFMPSFWHNYFLPFSVLVSTTEPIVTINYYFCRVFLENIFIVVYKKLCAFVY